MVDASERGAAPEPDEHLLERRVGGQTLVQGHFLEMRRDVVALPSGREATREYVVHPGAAVIVPLLDDGRLVLERQYRYPVGRVLVEFPAGKIDPDEPLLTCARRELLEETGYSAREWAYAGVMHNAPAYSTEGIHLFFARGLVAGKASLDEGEFIETVLMDEDELHALAAAGELTDVKTLVALLWLSRWRAGAWALQWQAPA